MIKLGQYILAGRLQAMAMLSLFSLLSLLIPPLSYLFASVVVALVTLRHGTTAAMQTMIGALLILQVFVLLTPINMLLPAAYALLVWLPVYVCSLALRISYSQTVMILTGVLIAAIVIVIMHLTLEDVPSWWQGMINEALLKQLPPELMTQYENALTQAANFINGLVFSVMLMSMVSTVLFARWWQSLLFNQGGFKPEFFALAFPLGLAVAMIISLIASGALPGKLGLISGDLGLVLICAFMFEGLSMLHQKVNEESMPKGMLIGMYVLLFIIPHIVIFLAMLGLVDSIKQYKQKQRHD